MTKPIDLLVHDLQEVLNRHKAEIFLPEMSEVWIASRQAGFILDRNSELVVEKYAHD